MVKFIINKQVVEKKMRSRHMTYGDLAEEMGVSPSMTTYIINRGSHKYAKKLAGIFQCHPDKLVKERV